MQVNLWVHEKNWNPVSRSVPLDVNLTSQPHKNEIPLPLVFAISASRPCLKLKSQISRRKKAKSRTPLKLLGTLWSRLGEIFIILFLRFLLNLVRLERYIKHKRPCLTPNLLTFPNTLKFKVKNDHHNKVWTNLSNWKEEAWRNQGFNGIITHDLRDTGAMLYQLSYEATHWEPGQFIEFISTRAVKWCEVYNSYISLWSTNAVQYELLISYILHIISLHGKIWTQ